MVVAPKKDGSPRRTVDLQKLNKATLRETHHTPSPFNQVSTVPPHTTKTVLDAWNSYHSLPLSTEARDATTFITEWGRYRYLRAPMGFQASGDAYTRRFDDIMVDMPRKTRIVDDTILWDSDLESSFWHALDYIKHCAQNGIIFNPHKFVFGKKEVDFGGFTLTEDGVKPTSNMIDAIMNFPTPQNISGMRSWFGLINQVAYSFAQAEIMAPFRELLSSKNKKFYWDETLDQIFNASKQKIVELIEEGVQNFEIERPTCLSSDWSEAGIGFFLRQKHCSCPTDKGPDCGNGHWRLIFAGSRFTTEAESRYAPVEGEALALVYALKSCRMFVLGCPTLMASVDHQPLLAIFGDRELEKITNPRLLNFKERSLMYCFTIKHTPGKKHFGPDATSRYPAPQAPDANQEQEEDLTDGIKSSLIASYKHDHHLQAVTWERIVSAAASDQECHDLTKVINQGFPMSRNELPVSIRQFWPLRDDLYTIDGVPAKSNKILIPRPLCAEVLECLHAAHQGVNRMLANARQRLFWPGLEAQLRQTRAQCKACNRTAPSQPREPLAEPALPQFPFQHTVADLCDISGNKYLVFADRYTGWVEAALMPDPNARKVWNRLRTWFCTYGAPAELASDGGPPFQSLEYHQFLKDWGISQRLSSAYYPQSNGRAESAVKTAKRILLDNTDSSGRLDYDHTARAFMMYRNTPVQDIGLSPVVMLFGRPIKDHLPTLWKSMSVQPQWKEIRELREKAMAKRHLRAAEYHDQHTRSLPPLSVGDSVLIQNQNGNQPTRWEKTGHIVETLPHRQYTIKVDGSNRITLRNRRFICKILPVAPAVQTSSPTSLQGPPLLYPIGASNPPVMMPEVAIPSPSKPVWETATQERTQADTEPNWTINPAPSIPEEPVNHQEMSKEMGILPPPKLPQTTSAPASPSTRNPASIPTEPACEPPRCSKRVSQPPRALSPVLRGKSHQYSQE